MKIGMIGVESKHAEFFGSLINGKKIIPGWQVTHIYPVDAPERLGYVQERVGQTKALGLGFHRALLSLRPRLTDEGGMPPKRRELNDF